ncbi:hypothetical protein JCM10212_003928 [Sporobolomyces blumeae]
MDARLDSIRTVGLRSTNSIAGGSSTGPRSTTTRPAVASANDAVCLAVVAFFDLAGDDDDDDKGFDRPDELIPHSNVQNERFHVRADRAAPGRVIERPDVEMAAASSTSPPPRVEAHPVDVRPDGSNSDRTILVAMMLVNAAEA